RHAGKLESHSDLCSRPWKSRLYPDTGALTHRREPRGANRASESTSERKENSTGKLSLHQRRAAYGDEAPKRTAAQGASIREEAEPGSALQSNAESLLGGALYTGPGADGG